MIIFFLFIFWSFHQTNELIQTLSLRPKEIRYYDSVYYDEYNQKELISMATGSNKYSLSCWAKLNAVPAVGQNRILFHLTMLNTPVPSDPLSVSSSIRHLSYITVFDVLNDAGNLKYRSYTSYFGDATGKFNIYTSGINIVPVGKWFFVYVGIDHIEKIYITAIFSEVIGTSGHFDLATNTYLLLTGDNNEQLDHRLLIFFGGSKGVPYSTTTNWKGFVYDPKFYANFYSSTYPGFSLYGEIERFFYFNLNNVNVNILDQFNMVNDFTFGTIPAGTSYPLMNSIKGLTFNPTITLKQYAIVNQQKNIGDFNMVSAWINIQILSGVVGDLSIFQLLNSNSDLIFSLFYQILTATTVKIFGKTVGTASTNGIVITLNVWHHFVVVFSHTQILGNTMFTLFIDGIITTLVNELIPVAIPSFTKPETLLFGSKTADKSFEGSLMDIYISKGGYLQIISSLTNNCKLYLGYQNQFCLYCSPLTFLYNGTCVLSCPKGTYKDTLIRSCRLCDIHCSECNGPLYSNCLNCPIAYPFLFKTYCFSQCPLGTIHRDPNSNYCECEDSCKDCSFNEILQIAQCSGCVNPDFSLIPNLYKCVQSTECPYSYFADYTSGTGICSLTCNVGLYYNNINRKCSTYCSTKSIKYEVSNTLRCLFECPSGEYNNTISDVTSLQNDQTLFQCGQCLAPCRKCFSRTFCLSCDSGLLLHEFNGTCAENCLPGYYQENNLCRICRINCNVCPYNYVLYGTRCLEKCPTLTVNQQGNCIIDVNPIIWITNKTNDDPLMISSKKDLILMADYINAGGTISIFEWNLRGVSSIYSGEFFVNTYRNLQILQIPKKNLRSNVVYNISVIGNPSFSRVENFIIVQTQSDVIPGVCLVSPAKGISGIDTFILTLVLWDFSNDLKCNLYSYLKVTVNKKNNIIYGRYDPNIIFFNIKKNGNFSFVLDPIQESQNITLELVAFTNTSEYRQNISLSVLAYPGNYTNLKEKLWETDSSQLNTIEKIFNTVNIMHFMYGQSYSNIYYRDLMLNIYKATQTLNQDNEYYCDDLIHCFGKGVCSPNPFGKGGFTCQCFKNFGGENCYWPTSDYMFLTNISMSALLNIQNIPLNSNNVFLALKATRNLIELQDILPKNGILMTIVMIQNILYNFLDFSLESLILIIENLANIMHSLMRRPVFRDDEKVKYTPLIQNLLDLALNRTESLLTLGESFYISSEFLDIFIQKRTKSEYLANQDYSNDSIVIPLSKFQVYIPFELLTEENIITLRVLQWKTIVNKPDQITINANVEIKSGNNKIIVNNTEHKSLVYLGKLAAFPPFDSQEQVYKCGVFEYDKGSFKEKGQCTFVNESDIFILFNCSILGHFEIEINTTTVKTPSLDVIMEYNDALFKNFSLNNLFQINFTNNYLVTKYINLPGKDTYFDWVWTNPGLYSGSTLIFLYIVSCLLNKKNWMKNRFEQILSENKPILILTYHPFVSLAIKAHSTISHTQQMRLTKLFLTHFSNLYGNALVFNELSQINTQITELNRIIGSIFIGLIISYIFHGLIEFAYTNIIMAFWYAKLKRNNIAYHILLWCFMLLFFVLTMYEMCYVRPEVYLHWLYVVLLTTACDVIIFYTYFVFYAYYTRNNGYFIGFLQSLGFYIRYEKNISLKNDDENEAIIDK